MIVKSLLILMIAEMGGGKELIIKCHEGKKFIKCNIIKRRCILKNRVSTYSSLRSFDGLINCKFLKNSRDARASDSRTSI